MKDSKEVDLVIETPKSSENQNENTNLTTEEKSKTHNYVVQVWVTVFMFFVLWYVLSELFNMDVGKDSLLYAKFLTVDAK